MALNSVLLVPISILKMPRNPLINCRNNEYLHIYGVIHLFECMGQICLVHSIHRICHTKKKTKKWKREREEKAFLYKIYIVSKMVPLNPRKLPLR